MQLNECDFTNPESIEQYAKQLEGMTFQEVLNLGIAPEGIEREYNKKAIRAVWARSSKSASSDTKPITSKKPTFQRLESS